MTNTLYFQGLRLWSNCGDPVQRRSIMWQVVPSLGEEDTGRIDYLDWTPNRPTASVSGVKKISGGNYDSGLRCLPNELPSVCWLHNSLSSRSHLLWIVITADVPAISCSLMCGLWQLSRSLDEYLSVVVAAAFRQFFWSTRERSILRRVPTFLNDYCASMSNKLPRPFPHHNPGPSEWTYADLVEHLQVAQHVELSTIPLYLYAVWSIKTDTVEGKNAAQKIRCQFHPLTVSFLHWACFFISYFGSGDASSLAGG